MSKLGDELVQSMAQALAHAQGKRTSAHLHKFATPEEIQKACKSLGLSQDEFANAFGVSASTLSQWRRRFGDESMRISNETTRLSYERRAGWRGDGCAHGQ